MKHSMRLEQFRRGKLQDAQCSIAVQNATLLSAPFFFEPRATVRRAVAWLLVALFTIVAMPWVNVERALAQGYHIYVPMVATEGTGPGGSGSTPEECGLNSEEVAVAKMMIDDPRQQRNDPVCDPTLAQVARGRARDMALRGYFSHTNPDGIGPNYLARQAGYPLPDWYSDDLNSNNIESIGGGYTSAGEVWQAWIDSSAHRGHVLGAQSFYAEQRAYGVGYYYNADAPLKHYWVFLSAPLPSGE